MKLEKYSRQTLLSNFGIEEQHKLFEASVLVIGAGGLGCPVLEILNSSGVGKIGIVDFDIIEIHNLHRQFLFQESDLGKSKAITAKEKLEKRNSDINIDVFNVRMTSKNIVSILENFDVVVDCTDNFSTRYLINDACSLLKKPLVYGSIYQYEGQVSVFNVRKDGVSTQYRDLFPIPPNLDEAPNCNEAGVLPAHSSLIGTIQANEAIKVIIESADVLANQLLVFNSLNYQTMIINFNENHKKGGPKTIEELQNFDYEEFCNLKKNDEINSEEELNAFLSQNNSVLIDVRELDEQPRITSFKNLEMPLSSLGEQMVDLKIYNQICLICASGIRSRKALDIITKQFPEKIIKHFPAGVKALK